MATLVSAIALAIVGFLLLESLGALSGVGVRRVFTDGSWHPTEGRFDLGAMVAGTALTTLGAVLLAAPLGIASAVFRRYVAPPRVGAIYGRVVELLAGIPSVVYGLWGLVVLVPLIGQLRPPGASLLAATLIVALMILPTVALLAEASFANVPRRYLMAAAALGLSRGTTLRCVVLPAARSGLATGVLLAVGRAIGETMAVLMVAGNVAEVPSSVFDPVRTLTANIALEMGYALGEHRSALFLSGLLLMGLVTALVSAAEHLRTRGTGG